MEGQATGETSKSCTMIITEPNKFVAEVHDRVPIILEPRILNNGSAVAEDAAALMKPAGENILQRWPVSTA